LELFIYIISYIYYCCCWNCHPNWKSVNCFTRQLHDQV